MHAIPVLLASVPVFVPDLIFVGLTIAFFATAIGFGWFCEKVR